MLVAEVVSPSNAYNDLVTKRDFYARFKIPEYWIVDLNEKTLEIHREPVGDGYVHRQKLAGDDVASPLDFPEVALRAGELFA